MTGTLRLLDGTCQGLWQASHSRSFLCRVCSPEHTFRLAPEGRPLDFCKTLPVLLSVPCVRLLWVPRVSGIMQSLSPGDRLVSSRPQGSSGLQPVLECPSFPRLSAHHVSFVHPPFDGPGVASPLCRRNRGCAHASCPRAVTRPHPPPFSLPLAPTILSPISGAQREDLELVRALPGLLPARLPTAPSPALLLGHQVTGHHSWPPAPLQECPTQGRKTTPMRGSHRVHT